jgi:hypothetical protein
MQGFSSTRSSDVTQNRVTSDGDSRKSVATSLRFAEGMTNRVIDTRSTAAAAVKGFRSAGNPPGGDDVIVIRKRCEPCDQKANAIRNVCGTAASTARPIVAIPITIPQHDIANGGGESAFAAGVSAWVARLDDRRQHRVKQRRVRPVLLLQRTQNRGIDHITFRNNVFENNRFQCPQAWACLREHRQRGPATARMPVISENIFSGTNDFRRRHSCAATGPCPEDLLTAGEHLPPDGNRH